MCRLTVLSFLMVSFFSSVFMMMVDRISVWIHCYFRILLILSVEVVDLVPTQYLELHAPILPLVIGGRSSTSVASSCDDTPEKCDYAGVGLWASAVGAQWDASLGRRRWWCAGNLQL